MADKVTPIPPLTDSPTHANWVVRQTPLKNTTTLLIFTISTVLVACGYQFVGVGQLPNGVRQIHVAVLENPTAETGIEVILANDLISELNRHGYHTARDRQGGDAILAGRIADLRIDSIAHRDPHSAISSRVTLSLHLSLTDADGTVLWIVKGLAANQTYDIAPDSKHATEENRRIAIRSISKRLAESVYDSLTMGF